MSISTRRTTDLEEYAARRTVFGLGLHYPKDLPWQILRLLAEGYTDDDISITLDKPLGSIRHTVNTMLIAYGAINRTHLVSIALRRRHIS